MRGPNWPKQYYEVYNRRQRGRFFNIRGGLGYGLVRESAMAIPLDSAGDRISYFSPSKHTKAPKQYFPM